MQEAFVIFDTNRNLHAGFLLRLPNADLLKYSGNGFLDQTEFYRFLVSCDSRVLDLAFQLFLVTRDIVCTSIDLAAPKIQLVENHSKFDSWESFAVLPRERCVAKFCVTQVVS